MMKFRFLPAWAAMLALSACAGNGISKRERALQVSNIKTQLALEYMKAQDFRQATASIEDALKANRKNETAWLVRAQIYQYLKVEDKAQESFQTALSLNPDSAEINNNYGWFLCSVQNRPQESVAYFDKALSDPTYPSPFVAHLNKGICTAKQGQASLAEAYFERALAAQPNFFPVFKELAKLKLSAGNIREAGRYFHQYREHVPLMQAGDLLLGWRLAQASGDERVAGEYEAQLRKKFPYSEELQAVETGRY